MSATSERARRCEARANQRKRAQSDSTDGFRSSPSVTTTANSIGWDVEALESTDGARETSSSGCDTPSSSDESEPVDDRKSAVRLHLSPYTEDKKRGKKWQPKRFGRIYSRKQLDWLYPPDEREEIGVLYRWSLELTKRERCSRAPYCFRSSDGQPNAWFRDEFDAYEARLDSRRTRKPTNTTAQDQTSMATARRPMTPASSRPSTPQMPRIRDQPRYSCLPLLKFPLQPNGVHSLSVPDSIPIQIPTWKGKGRQPTDDTGRIVVLEKRMRFMEEAMKQSFDQVAEGQDRAVDARIQLHMAPLREEQQRISELVHPLGEQMQGVVNTVTRELKDLKNDWKNALAAGSGRPGGGRPNTPEGSPVLFQGQGHAEKKSKRRR